MTGGFCPGGIMSGGVLSGWVLSGWFLSVCRVGVFYFISQYRLLYIYTVCTPVLTYGLDGRNINATNMKKLETTQGNLIKQCLGISKRCHSTVTQYVHNISDLVKRNTVSIFNRISSPAKES